MDGEGTAGTVAERAAAAPGEMPVVAGAAGAGDPAAWASAVFSPPKVRSVTATAAVTHTATATAAITGPGWALRPAQLSCRMAGESLERQNDPARLTTRRRCATASLSGEVQQVRTSSRSSGGSGKDGSSRENAAGRSAPHLCCAQVWHSSMCQLTSSRVSSVSCPFQSASNSPRTGQAVRLVSAMCSAPRACSSWPRARAAKVCARLHDTSSAIARSSSFRSCAKLSSMTSRSPGFSPARMAWIRLLSSSSSWLPWARTRSPRGWPMTGNGIVTSVGRPATSSGMFASRGSRPRSGSRPTARNWTVASAAPGARAPSGSRPTAANCTVASAAPGARAPSGSRPTAANCTVASAAPGARAPSGSRPTAANCTVASAAPGARAPSGSRPTAANCTVASAAPGARAPSGSRPTAANCTVASAAPGARARPAPGPPQRTAPSHPPHPAPAKPHLATGRWPRAPYRVSRSQVGSGVGIRRGPARTAGGAAWPGRADRRASQPR